MWLSAKIRDSEIFLCGKRFIVYRYDREFRSGGGVLIAVSANLTFFCVNISTNLEFLCVCVSASHKRIIFVFVIDRRIILLPSPMSYTTFLI